MEVEQGARAAHHERAAAEAVVGTVEEVQLFFCGDFVDLRIGEVLQCGDDFIDIVDNQLLGAEPGFFVQGRGTHAPGHVVVAPRMVHDLPAVKAGAGVIGLCRLFPFFVTGGVFEVLFEFFRGGDDHVLTGGAARVGSGLHIMGNEYE
jgi:hypothetical protein